MVKLKFVKSAAQLKDFPIDGTPEVALAGRSNAGKSSLINVMANSKIAKVSGTPGKTRLLNLFEHHEGYRLVDMPGYGYASRSGSEVVTWRKMIETFLSKRENLKILLLIMDIRRDWAEEEQMLLDFADEHDLQFGLILSKSDKLTFSQIKAAKNKLLQSVSVDLCIPFSTLKKQGLTELEKALYDWLHP